ncbi:hypothetical protein P7C70_g2418, partial [Phenoliferia sp. Uapishka_3]
MSESIDLRPAQASASSEAEPSIVTDFPAPPAPTSHTPTWEPVHLPHEILSAIFEKFLIHFDFDDLATARSTRRTLYNCCLVAMSWADPAQRALYEHPLFTDRSLGQLAAPSQWLQGNARLRYITRAMDFATSRYGLGTEVLLDVLGATTDLDDVRLGYINSGDPWKLLTLPAVSHLTSLTLSKLDWWWTFPEAAEIPPLHLKTLNLTLRRDAPNVNLILALFTTAAPTLHTLELELMNEPGHPGAGNDLSACLDTFLPVIAPTLCHVVLVVHYKIDGVERILQQLPNLLSFRLDFRHELDHILTLYAVIHAIPTSVREVTFGWERRRSAEPELSVVLQTLNISLPSLSELKKIELRGVDSEQLGDVSKVLVERMSERVEVVCRPWRGAW